MQHEIPCNQTITRRCNKLEAEHPLVFAGVADPDEGACHTQLNNLTQSLEYFVMPHVFKWLPETHYFQVSLPGCYGLMSAGR